MTIKNNHNINLIRYIGFITILFIVSSCAQVIPLSGGETDKTPPKVVSCYPQQQAVNFTDNKISIEFDEYFKLNSVFNQFIISPKLNEQPDFNVNGKKLEVKFNGLLAPNTTYRLNFGASISDINENNILSDFELVFSTGQSIDHAFISGQLLHASSLKPIAGASVGLYSISDDSVVFREKPVYLGKTNAEGNYSLSYIKSGTYKVIAIMDKNSNGTYDIGETIAFGKPLNIIDSVKNYDMFGSEEVSSRLFLKKTSQPYPEKAILIFNKKMITPPEISVKTKSGEDFKSIRVKFKSQNDSLWLYYPIQQKDSLEIRIAGVPEPVYLMVQGKEEIQNQFNRKRLPLEIKPDLKTNNNLSFFKPFVFYSNFIIKSYDVNQFVLMAGETKIPLKPDEIQIKEDSIFILKKWKQDEDYALTLMPGAVTDFFERKNDSLRFAFKTDKQEDYGSLFVQLKPQTQPTIIQLIDSKSNCTSSFYLEANTNPQIHFTTILPDTYTLKFIQDLNRDQVFTGGDYLRNVQPEPVKDFPEKIKIMAGWDNEIKPDLNFN